MGEGCPLFLISPTQVDPLHSHILTCHQPILDDNKQNKTTRTLPSLVEESLEWSVGVNYRGVLVRRIDGDR